MRGVRERHGGDHDDAHASSCRRATCCSTASRSTAARTTSSSTCCRASASRRVRLRRRRDARRGGVRRSAKHGGGKLAMVFLETPANPTNAQVDIRDVRGDRGGALHEGAERCSSRWTTRSSGPLWQQPLAHGADLVLYSATKFLGGHSDLIGGACLGLEGPDAAREGDAHLPRHHGEPAHLLAAAAQPRDAEAAHDRADEERALRGGLPAAAPARWRGCTTWGI